MTRGSDGSLRRVAWEDPSVDTVLAVKPQRAGWRGDVFAVRAFCPSIAAVACGRRCRRRPLAVCSWSVVPASPLGLPRSHRRPGCSGTAAGPPDGVEGRDDRIHTAGARRQAGDGLRRLRRAASAPGPGRPTRPQPAQQTGLPGAAPRPLPGRLDRRPRRPGHGPLASPLGWDAATRPGAPPAPWPTRCGAR